MGARHSAYLTDVDEPQPRRAHDDADQGPDSAPGGTRPPARPPPLNLSAAPAPAPSRRRVPICSALDTVDFASTHPHSPTPSPMATGLVDVWIIAGQSNAVGDNAPDGMPIPAACQPMPGLVLSYDSTGRWRDAAPNIHAGIHGYDREPSCGPAIAFGRTLIALGLSSRVGLVPTARGATNLFHDWRPTGGGEYYSAMIARTRAALAEPLPGGGSGRLRGMIWVQGEADAETKHGPEPSEMYGANFAAFVHSVRRDLASFHAQLPIIMGVMSVRKRDCFPYLPAVRRAQLGVPLPGLLRVDLAGYEFFEEYGGFHVHLTKDGAAALGAAMAHTYYCSVVRAGLPRRPGDIAAATVATFALGTPAASSGGGAASTAASGGGAADATPAVIATAAPPTRPAQQLPAVPAVPDEPLAVRVGGVAGTEVASESQPEGRGPQSAHGDGPVEGETGPVEGEQPGAQGGGGDGGDGGGAREPQSGEGGEDGTTTAAVSDFPTASGSRGSDGQAPDVVGCHHEAGGDGDGQEPATATAAEAEARPLQRAAAVEAEPEAPAPGLSAAPPPPP